MTHAKLTIGDETMTLKIDDKSGPAQETGAGGTH
jgi:hypothetical protein